MYPGRPRVQSKHYLTTRYLGRPRVQSKHYSTILYFKKKQKKTKSENFSDVYYALLFLETKTRKFA